MMDFSWWPHIVDARVASYRIRCAQIIRFLKERGYRCGEWRPGDPAPRALILSKRYDEDSVKIALNLRSKHGTRLVLDLCDNHFYAGNSHPRWRSRAETLRRAVENMDLVIASSVTLADVIRAECGSSPSVEVIEDAVENPEFLIPKTLSGIWANWQLWKFQRRINEISSKKTHRIVWFGNHASSYAEGGMSDLLNVRDLLESAHEKTPLTLTVISNSFQTFKKNLSGWKLPAIYVPWQGENFSNILVQHGVCVIPIQLNPFTLCKTNNRVATALLHGLTVVADAIPSYEELGPYISLNDWPAGLATALSHCENISSGVERGNSYIRNNYSLDKIGAKWVKFLQ